jgi:prepilin peptidase CpaA
MPLSLENQIAFVLTAAACLAGAVVDVRSRRIPNLITFGAMAALLAVHGIFSGLPGLADAALGLLGCFIITLVPHLFRVLGAGDVKLMAAVGAGLGARAVVTVVLFTSLAGGVQFVLWLAWLHLFRRAPGKGYRLCYGPAIAAGALGAMAMALAGLPYVSLKLPGF